MKPKLRPPTLDETLRKLAGTGKRREIIVDPESGFLGTRTLSAALRKAAHGDIVLVPGGEYEAFELKKGIEVRSLAGTVAVIKGTITIQSDHVALHGLELRAAPGQPAVQVKKGYCVIDDCIIHGGVVAGSPGERVNFFLRSSLITGADEGVSLMAGASGEISASRIANCRHGLSLAPQTFCALYHSRIEACINTVQAEPGAGVLAEQAMLYCEGTSFSGNGVGLYLKHCPDTQLISCGFDTSEASAIISIASTTEELGLRSCAIGHQDSAECAQIALSGGFATLENCEISTSPATALSAEGVRLEFQGSQFASRENPALDLRSCHVAAANIECRSTNGAAMVASACQGVIRQSLFQGAPPIQHEESPQLLLEGCEAGPFTPKTEPAMASGPVTIDSITQSLNRLVSQESIRNDLERLLRLAHAGQQRRKQGLPSTEQNFHSLFFGPAGTGKVVAAQVLAEGLHSFGAIATPKIAEISLGSDSLESWTKKQELGVAFLRVPEATSSAPDLTEMRNFVENLVQRPGVVVILAGERDQVRRLLRPSAALDRIFRNIFSFSSFGALELTTLFARFCERSHIVLNPETMRALLLAFHLYSDRKDRRFANTQGVGVLFEASQRRYLERCSMSNRFDLLLEPRDLDMPQDKALRSALDRSPAFVTICPSCAKENPWLPGLNPRTVCLHCEAVYSANWGIWKDSATYRRMKENLTHSVETGVVARRANLPTR